MNKNNSESEDLEEDQDSSRLRDLAKAISLSPASMFEFSSNSCKHRII